MFYNTTELVINFKAYIKSWELKTKKKNLCAEFFFKPFKLLALSCCSILVKTEWREKDRCRGEPVGLVEASKPKDHREFGFFSFGFHFVLVWSEPWSEQSPPNACLRAQPRASCALSVSVARKSPFLVNRANPCLLPHNVPGGEENFTVTLLNSWTPQQKGFWGKESFMNCFKH